MTSCATIVSCQVNMMEEKLKNAPIPLSPVIRTLAPGHVGCSTALHRKFQPSNQGEVESRVVSIH